MVRRGAFALGICAATALCSGNLDAPHCWWSGPQVTLLGSPSRDGRMLSFADPPTGALAIRNLATGTSRSIATRPAGSHEFAYFSVFSRDGAKVAYAWFNDRGFYDLRIASADGHTPPRVVYRNEEAGFVQPCAWTPDGKNVLTLLFRRDNISQIALVPAAGGPLHVLRSLDWVYPKRMDLSPDGRWVVYDNFAAEGKPERTIFLLSVDGSQERRIVNLPGNYLFPLWSPDGRRVIFAGDNGGPQRIWTVEVENGRPVGEPVQATGSLGRILPLGVTDKGELFYGARTGETVVYTAPLDGAQREAKPVVTRFPGRNTAPAWSPDGKRLAYLSRRGTENFGADVHAIVVLDLGSGAEHELNPRLAHIERLAWSPDGKSLLAAGSDGKARGGLFTVSAADGTTTAIVAERDAPFRGFEAVWAPDGKSIYYLRSETQLVEHRLADGTDVPVLHAGAMRHLAIEPHGRFLAVGIGGSAIRVSPLQGDGVPRLIPFAGLTELAWGGRLYAGRGAALWSVPLDGAQPQPVALPRDRLAGVTLSPDGRRVAFAAGAEQSEVRSVRLALP